MKVDAKATAGAMSGPVVSRKDIERKFGSITYSKGASVIRMMEGILGRKVLLQGLSSYLAALQYSNSVEEQLFSHLDTAGVEAGVWPQSGVSSLETTMKTWTNQVRDVQRTESTPPGWLPHGDGHKRRGGGAHPGAVLVRDLMVSSTTRPPGTPKRKAPSCGTSPSTGWRWGPRQTGATPRPWPGSPRRASPWLRRLALPPWCCSTSWPPATTGSTMMRRLGGGSPTCWSPTIRPSIPSTGWVWVGYYHRWHYLHVSAQIRDKQRFLMYCASQGMLI